MSFLEPESEDASQEASKSGCGGLVGLSCLLLAGVCAIIAPTSFLSFDAPGSGTSPVVVGSVIGFWTAPFLLVWAFTLSAIRSTRRDYLKGLAILCGVLTYFLVILALDLAL